jgi:putative ABC transport system ATP-binding protein
MAVELNPIKRSVTVGPERVAVVSATELTRRYGDGETGVDALRGVSLAVRAGEVVAVMGPSGSGKSTLLHILAGLDRPTSGEAFIGGIALSTLHDQQLTLLRRHKIGFVFQFFNLLPMLSTEQNIVLPLKLAGQTPDAEWVDEVIASVGLDERRDHRPAELSGGQQQRVAIARALITRPSILFADEPTGNLDSKVGREVLELLRSCAAVFGQTILTVTHEPRVSSIADRILLLADGLVVQELDHVTSQEVRSAIDALAS